MDPVEFHRQLRGKIEVISRTSISSRAELSLAYTPGVAEACLAIVGNLAEVYNLTRKNNMVAVVTDGSAVLGLGNIGPEASLPVMEGKAILFKEFADVDAFPIALKTQDVDEIVRTVELISPMFGGINLEDISAPRCFEIEERLNNLLDIPVFHDDQHGTAIVVLAGLYNAFKVVGKEIDQVTVVINGVGAAGIAVTKLLFYAGVKKIILVDSKGIIYEGRDDLNSIKEEMSKITNPEKRTGNLAEAVHGTDVFIGVSKPGLLTQEMVKTMNDKSIIFAMANPTPEIMPNLAHGAGAMVVATGRSDFPNQINNVLAFPGIFRGLFDGHIRQVTMDIKLNVARALADYVKNPRPDCVIPDTLDKNVSGVVAEAVKNSKKNIIIL
ncbi:MAG: NAD-dependent malic enzyme [Candidatus Magasanikbacteria bacterium CG_4_10_14_0_2_um_filter_37_12]|uniref:NAD-dependent malic enzyme n=1 Tax=Candidatus Magasanikbacteria bacterium CG_4_10_14_0_2_um_filter_37_12 TaxID=1974637 RepID=A0A2M7VA07_9BACT|nr:MAG: NAD-dependent malic enzyme [Candidatus Magasanikbacteria bacterium CG_4_10_14_0_2_um_filter_37_12]